MPKICENAHVFSLNHHLGRRQDAILNLSGRDQFGTLQLYYLHTKKRYLAIFLLILEGFVNVEYKSLQSIVQ